MSKLHPGVKWDFRLGCHLLLGFVEIVLGLSFLAPLFAHVSRTSISYIIIIYIFSSIISNIVISEIYTVLSYNAWFYELTEDGIKIERGIIWKKYSYVPYERIQNVDISRGILARMLSFSKIIIQTAGYSGYQNAEGNIPAVDVKKADEIRDFIMDKISKKKK